jgi:hypothetical protein
MQPAWQRREMSTNFGLKIERKGTSRKPFERKMLKWLLRKRM